MSIQQVGRYWKVNRYVLSDHLCIQLLNLILAWGDVIRAEKITNRCPSVSPEFATRLPSSITAYTSNPACVANGPLAMMFITLSRAWQGHWEALMGCFRERLPWRKNYNSAIFFKKVSAAPRGLTKQLAYIKYPEKREGPLDFLCLISINEYLGLAQK